ncbi:acyltransferase domain-containing protein [Streptomyces sp. NPDC088674]|uniref:acyltransferase domain-containing protein n=1 Tax=Streptomyces sp. NPDC088674 TaxID=3365869 RepID=UPI0037F17EC2
MRSEGGTEEEGAPVVALLLPGQGAQRARMAAGLHGVVPEFTTAVEECFAVWGTWGEELRARWLDGAGGEEALERAAVAQPLLFAVGYGLGRALGAGGQGAPHLLLGHSVGELAAAALAGVCTPGAALRLLAERDAVLRAAPSGGMLAVAAPVDELRPYVGADVVVGAVNGPRQTVLCGPEAPLRAVARRLADDGLTARRLQADVPFHSPALAGAARRLTRASAERIARWRPPAVPLWSGRTGRALTPGEAVRAAFWCGQLAAPVLYWPALENLLATATATATTTGGGRGVVLLDASPDGSLGAPARRHPAVRSGAARVVRLLPARPGDPADDVRAFRAALQQAGQVVRDGG